MNRRVGTGRKKRQRVRRDDKILSWGPAQKKTLEAVFLTLIFFLVILVFCISNVNKLLVDTKSMARAQSFCTLRNHAEVA